MTTYLWQIDQMNCVPSEDGLTDVVATIHWRCNASQDEYTASVYGTVGVTLDQSKAFTPYSSLTKDQVVGWVQESMGIDGVTALQQNLDNQIANEINPPIVTLPNPWSI